MQPQGAPPPPRRIRVCHVITRLELGGAQRNTLYTVRHLDRRRFEVSLIAGRGGMLDGEAECIPDVTTMFVPPLIRPVHPVSDARALVSLVRIFRRLQPDIVHTHSSKAGILGRWAARYAAVPVIVHTIHGYGFHERQAPPVYWLLRASEVASARITSHFITVSRADLDAGVHWGLFPPSRVTLIRSGVELAAFPSRDRHTPLHDQLGLTPDAPLVGMVACLKPQKAPLDFVRLAQRVLARIQNAHFVLVGDGDLRARVESEVIDRGLAHCFHMLGWRCDVPAILESLSVFVLTSLWEGLPRVVPEAMAAGTPVVATRVNGTPEAVADGVTGYLVEPGDIETMAERIVFLLQHPAEARCMGQQGHDRVAEFCIDRMVSQQEDLYRELAAR
ncbi:MAG: glycosyltransferase family 4 protein [Deltaproteobacteria bacterium]|nr:glycosyltransferase family 4 protein [Deltaproteobacteria bacterium]